MAAVAQEAGLAVEVSAFEEWEPAGRRLDGVVPGQSWHWMDPVAGAASALEAGGRVAVFSRPGGGSVGRGAPGGRCGICRSSRGNRSWTP